MNITDEAQDARRKVFERMNGVRDAVDELTDLLSKDEDIEELTILLAYSITQLHLAEFWERMNYKPNEGERSACHDM